MWHDVTGRFGLWSSNSVIVIASNDGYLPRHFSYLSSTTVSKSFAAHGLTMFDMEQLPTHGGWLRIDARKRDKTVVGYAAPGKVNTPLHYCGSRSDFLDFTVDRNPCKQVKFTPRHAHPDPAA